MWKGGIAISENQLTLFAGDDSLIVVQPRDVAGLSLIPGLGIQGIRRLVEHFRDLGRVWHAAPDEVAQPLREAKVRSSASVGREIAEGGQKAKRDGQQELERLAERHTSIVTVSDPRYPKQLLEADAPPFWLYVEGDPDLLRVNNQVAVVGTRRPSVWGVRMATEIASWLAQKEITVVAGLAEGIDEAAQQACVDAGARTIAVLGHGVNMTFPAATAALRQEISKQGGAVVSEYLPKDRSDSARFVQRNRIQAALSKAVIPIEAEYTSGTAHTVRFAHRYKRALIGLKYGDMTPGIARLVEELGAPVVDLTKCDAHMKIETCLGISMGRSLEESLAAQKRAVLARYAGEFKSLTNRYDLEDDDLEFLFDRLKSVMRERLDLGGNKRRSD